MAYCENLMYRKQHEWIVIEGNRGRIGITEFAQKKLGDVVFVELPKVGQKVELGETLGVVESVKVVSDIYSPCTGVVIAVNELLFSNPELVNEEPFADGWLLEVEVDKVEQDLLTPYEYEKYVSKVE